MHHRHHPICIFLILLWSFKLFSVHSIHWLWTWPLMATFICTLVSFSFMYSNQVLLPRVFGLPALDFYFFCVRSGRQVCLSVLWTAFWRVLLKLKALCPFQEVNCCSPSREGFNMSGIGAILPLKQIYMIKDSVLCETRNFGTLQEILKISIHIFLSY